MLGGEIVVTEFCPDRVRVVEDTVALARQTRFSAVRLCLSGDGRLGLGPELRRLTLNLGQQRKDNALLLAEQCEEEMIRCHLGVGFCACPFEGAGHSLLRLYCPFVGVNSHTDSVQALCKVDT